MNTTTNFDLNQTASAAALNALTQDALGVESIKLEAFTAAGHDRADFAQWSTYFTNNLLNYQNLKKQSSPSATAATKFAKQAVPAPNTAANKTQASATTGPAQPA